MKIKYTSKIEIDFDLEKIERVLLLTCQRDTSYNPEEYVTGFDGHCKAVALAIKIFIGGKLVKGKVGRKDHYWNILPNDTEYDPTFAQFPPGSKKTQGTIVEINSSMNPRFVKFLDRFQENYLRENNEI